MSGHKEIWTIHFAIALEDGSIVDSSWEEGEPLQFVPGDGTLLPALEQCVLTLQVGQRRQFTLSPEEGFGVREQERIVTMARTQFPADMELEAGLVVGFASEEGGELPGLIMAVDENEVRVDLNHPLAGHTIQLDVEVLNITP